MKSDTIAIKPFGEQAISIEWPNRVEEAILNDILEFKTYLKDHLDSDDWEMVPAYNSLTLINKAANFEFDELQHQLQDWYSRKKESTSKEHFLWELPVCYAADYGIDLQEVSEFLGLTIEALITLHTSIEYTVYGIGFLPGFMYLGGLPKHLETPRRSTPRLKVSKGSVGLAGKQTGIYPQESPGGWNIIGRCPISIFDPTKNPPIFVNVGDKIRFFEITQAEYDLKKIESEVGIYKVKKTRLNA